MTGEGFPVVGQLDTGNDHTCIQASILSRLGVAEGDAVSVNGVTGGSFGRKAVVTIGITFDGDYRVTINEHEVVSLGTMPCDALIGRDFLEFFSVKISTDGTTIISRD